MSVVQYPHNAAREDCPHLSLLDMILCYECCDFYQDDYLLWRKAHKAAGRRWVVRRLEEQRRRLAGTYGMRWAAAQWITDAATTAMLDRLAPREWRLALHCVHAYAWVLQRAWRAHAPPALPRPPPQPPTRKKAGSARQARRRDASRRGVHA